MKLRSWIWMPVTAALVVPAAMNAHAAPLDPDRTVPSGTLHYRIVLTGHAVNRSAEKNAADAKVLHLPLKTIADAETLRRVVEVSVHLAGATWRNDPLADETQKEISGTGRQEAADGNASPQAAYQKAMQACRKGGTVDLDCVQATLRKYGPELDRASEATAAANTRFDLWSADSPCRLKVTASDTANGVVMAGSAGAAGQVYRLSGGTSQTLDCAGGGAVDFDGARLVTADTVKNTYSVLFPAFSVDANATKQYQEIVNVPGEKAQRASGSVAIPYKIAVPSIVIRDLGWTGEKKPVSGTKHLKAIMTVSGAMGIGFVKFSKEGGAPVNARLPLDAVVTWTFTPDEDKAG